MNTGSAALMLLVLMDPLGNLPLFTSALREVAPARRLRVLVRELVFALAFLVVLLFAGKYVFSLFHLKQESLSIGGGLVLLVISYRMLFPGREGLFGDEGEEPFVVPLAIPLVAGPSTISLLLLLAGSEPERSLDWLMALLLAWSATAAILACSGFLGRVLGRAGLTALQRLMGMLLICLAVQMVLDGIYRTWETLRAS